MRTLEVNGNRHSEPEKISIAMAYDDGEDLLELAKKHRISTNTIHGWHKYYSNEIRGRKRRIKAIAPNDEELSTDESREQPVEFVATEDQRKFIKAEIAAGATPSDIAYALEISLSELTKVIEEIQQTPASPIIIRRVPKPIEENVMIEARPQPSATESNVEALKKEIDRLRRIIGMQAIELMELKGQL